METKIPERNIKKSIVDFLRLQGWFTFHIAQGQFAYKGISDLIALKDNVTLFIEVKTSTGKQSDYQKKFEKDVIEHGGHYIVARSADDVNRYICDNFWDTNLLL